jgi:tetratricopeptide (TPR) repeat protein
MSLIHEPRVYRIRVLQRAYSALQQDLPFLEERVYLLRDVVAEPVSYAFHPSELTLVSIAEQQCDLGAALLERYMHLRERKDLDEAEPHLRTALPYLPLDHLYVRCSSLLGSVLRECAFETKSAQMAEEALVIHRKLYADHTRFGVHTLERAYHSRELGWTLHIYFQMNKANVHTLFESLERLNEAHALFTAREGQVADGITLLGLCDVLVFLFGHLNGDKVYIDNSIACGEHALATCSSNHRDVFRITRRLAHVRAFLGSHGDLAVAVNLFRGALASAPPPRWVTLLSLQLMETLLQRYSSHGRQEDLDEAIVAGPVLAATLSPGVEGWGKLQECLIRMRTEQFATTGRPEHIEAAASIAKLVCTYTASGTTAHSWRLVQLARCRLKQYRAFGDMTCLNECIETLELVMQQAGAYWKDAARNLLVAYHLQHYSDNKGARHITKIHRAMEILRMLNAEGGALRTYSSLGQRDAGNILRARFEATEALEDLDQATVLHQAAASADQSDPDISYYLDDYATTLRIRYEVLHEEESISKALVLQMEALEATPEAHPDRIGVSCRLAHLQLYTCVSRTQGCATKALDHILDALNSHYCPAYRRLRGVSDILTSPYLAAYMPVLSDDNALKLCVVYSTAIGLLPQVASFVLEPRVRLAVIAGAGQLTVQGATHAISIGRLNQALEMLEAGRNVFWTQGLRLRTSFTDLPKTMGDRLTEITYALAQPPLELPDKDRELSRRRKLAEEFQTVLVEARLEPGFEDLLRNASFNMLARAAERHPLVVFLANEVSGHAIILSANARCRLVALPKANIKALRALSLRIDKHTETVRDSRGMRIVKKGNAQPIDLYREIWTSIMFSIVDALRWPVSVIEVYRVVRSAETDACLDGVRTRAETAHPLSDGHFHAATAPRSRHLHRKQPSVLFRLLRGVVHPVHWGASPCPTVIPARAQILRDGDAGRGCRSAVPRRSASRGHHGGEHRSGARLAVQDFPSVDYRWRARAPPDSLACHGTQNLPDALQSGFHLEDAMLTISKLTKLELPRAFLAVLSACETAKGDAAQPDQAIHLAGAMLFAGFKSVVATMWYVLLLLHLRRILTPSATAGPCVTRRVPSLPKASTPLSLRQVTHPRT